MLGYTYIVCLVIHHVLK